MTQHTHTKKINNAGTIIQLSSKWSSINNVKKNRVKHSILTMELKKIQGQENLLFLMYLRQNTRYLRSDRDFMFLIITSGVIRPHANI